jgi:hypothetical protein
MFIFRLTPFCSVNVHHKPVVEKKGSITCVMYGQDGTQFDRGFPNFASIFHFLFIAAFGVAQYAFASSLGYLLVDNV